MGLFARKPEAAPTATASPVFDRHETETTWHPEDDLPGGAERKAARLAALRAQRIAEAEAEAEATTDEAFAQAVWDVQVNEAFHDPIGGGPSRRVARIISYDTASGLTPGQLAALQRLDARVDKARDVLGNAELRRASGRLQVVPGANGRNF